jgi:hypothetical protein
MTNPNPFEQNLALLKKEIESMHTSLDSYSKKSSANPDYVKLRADALNRLVCIYNGLENEFRLLEVLYPIATSMKSLISKDPEIGQFAIHLHIKQNSNCGHIYYNPLE